jgi:hypothetical protein
MENNLLNGFSVRSWEAVNPSFGWDVIENVVIANGRGLAVDPVRTAARQACVDAVVELQVPGVDGVDARSDGP